MSGVRRFGSIVFAVLRVGAGLLFMEHGVQKVFGLLGGFGGPGQTAVLASRFGAAGVLECVGGLLLIVGLFTRPVALVLLLEMLVAFATVHFPQGGSPMQNGGELALLYALIFTVLLVHGAGPFSIDNRR
jgi:putative oxidoreductase